MKNVLKIIITVIIIMLNITSAFADVPVEEQRNLQTRYYETTDVNKVFKAAINTLQDGGYTIINIEPEVGFIRARTDNKRKRTNRAKVAVRSTDIVFRSALLTLNTMLGVVDSQSALKIADDTMWIKNELQEKTIIQDINVVIGKYDNKTRVRISLRERVLENADGYCYMVSAPRSVSWIIEELTFQNIFSEMSKSLYLEDQKLSI